MCLSASLHVTWEIFTPRHLLLPLAFITFIMASQRLRHLIIFRSTYISTYIHASIRMDIANHTVDAYSSYGGGEASFIHEVLFTPLNLESPCVAFLCHQQNKTLLKNHNVLTSVCHALLLLLQLLFWGILLMCFKESHLCGLLCLRSVLVVTLCKNYMYPNSMPRHMSWYENLKLCSKIIPFFDSLLQFRPEYGWE